MALTSGTKLGPYEIQSPLGAGGMGEVYRARDTKLNRDVAIKVLPDLVARDADRMARFIREAQTLASLNHPNIAQIYGLEESGGVRALVIELVEGEDLTAHIARGPIPLNEALPIARQIAEALEAAHESGIVHRDLKPANVKVRIDGTVKVLDFGLAKAMDPAGSSSANLANSPTLTGRATQMGVILGTAAYMSPEQAKGKPVDRRADIWAFGVVLYEMLTGERLFKGEDMSETLASVLKDTPSYASLPAQVPPRLRRLLERCLDRDVKERLRDIGEARVEIAKIQSGAADTAVIPAPVIAAPSPAKVNRSIVLAAVAAAILAAVAVAWWFGREHSATEPAWSEFTQLTDASGVETGPSISPDGQSFAYASKAKGSWDIYVQRVGGRNPVVVAGDATRDEVWPSFSPDGKQIAYSLSGGRGGIFVVGATGESARRLTDFGSNPAWSPDGQHIVFCTEEVISPYATYSNSTLWTVDLNGSGPTKIQDEVSAYQPAWSPSGRRIAFWQNVQGQRDLATIPASGGPRVMVTSDVAVDWAPVWSPDGHFLYFASDRGGSMGIWRIAIDEASGRPQGAPEVIAAGADGSMDLPHLSADGSSLIFRSMIESTNPAAIAFDPKTERAGEVRLLQHRTGNLIPMDVSPDGQWIALNNLFERQQDIFIMRPDGTGLTRLTDDMARDWFPRFTPDSTAVTFISNKSGAYDGWFIRLDGSNRIRLTDLPNDEVNIAMLAPDGRRLLAMGEKGTKIGSPPWPITPKTSIELRDLSVGGGSLGLTYWSRGGRWLSGMILQPSGETRGNALYDVATDKVRQLSDDAGGYELAWLPGSTRVVYFTNSDKLVIQDVESLKRREIEVKLPFPPEAGREITASPDGRTLYYGARQVEANIWKVERSAARVKQ